MSHELIANERFLQEGAITERFLDSPGDDTFAELFSTFTPCPVASLPGSPEPDLAEDLAQEVMLTVYRKATQLRDRRLFHAWMFKIARNALCRHYEKRRREVETVDLADVANCQVAASHKPAGTPAFEFLHWMAFLDSREREVMTLRFVEQWEYHEIAAAQALPIGTLQWRVFNAKKKLAPHLKTRENCVRKAA